MNDNRTVVGRASLEALWAREGALLARLVRSAVHDLNNALASVQTNAYLLQDSVSGEDAEALQAIETAVEFGIATSRSLNVLRTTSPSDSPAQRLDVACESVLSLLQTLGRSDVRCSVRLSPGADDLLVAGPLIEDGILTLATLAAELLPPEGELCIEAAAVADPPGHHLALSLSQAPIRPFLAGGRASLPDAVAGLQCVQLVTWLARHHGGDLLVAPPNSDGVVFDLFLPQAASSDTRHNARQKP